VDEDEDEDEAIIAEERGKLAAVIVEVNQSSL
jgi:hypothetical protein